MKLIREWRNQCVILIRFEGNGYWAFFRLSLTMSVLFTAGTGFYFIAIDDVLTGNVKTFRIGCCDVTVRGCFYI